MLSMIMCTARYMVYAHHVVFLCVCITLCWFKGSVHMLLVCLGSSVGRALASGGLWVHLRWQAFSLDTACAHF